MPHPAGFLPGQRARCAGSDPLPMPPALVELGQPATLLRLSLPFPAPLQISTAELRVAPCAADLLVDPQPSTCPSGFRVPQGHPHPVRYPLTPLPRWVPHTEPKPPEKGHPPH